MPIVEVDYVRRSTNAFEQRECGMIEECEALIILCVSVNGIPMKI
jgi:hypothetical protein